MVPRRLVIGKRLQRAGKGTILKPQPCPARTHVELIVERVGLTKTKCLLLAVKGLVHDESDAGVAVLGQREGDHRPSPSAPGERGVGDVLVFGERCDVRIAESQEMFARNRVIGDHETRLAIDQRNWTTETASPETSRVHFARGPCLA